MNIDLFLSGTNHIYNIRSLAGGVYYAESIGADPYIVINSGPFTKHYIHVLMKIDNPKAPASEHLHSKVYFREKGMSHFDEAHSISEPIKGFGDFYAYGFKCLPFQVNDISAIRFDPINCPAEFSIKEFELRSYRDNIDGAADTEVNKLNLLLISFFPALEALY